MTRWMVRVTHARVDGQIVLGENLRELFDGYVPEDRIFVVPNGGDYSLADAPRCRREDRFRALFLSNFHASKGILETLDAAKILSQQDVRVEFVFAGSWKDEGLRRQVEARLAGDPTLPVKFVGPIRGEKKLRLFASSDIFVLPTYYPNEGHPWVIVEAMGFGLPVISTDHAAIPESVQHGVNGFLVAKRSAEEVAARVRQLIEHAGLRRRMSEASRRLYETELTEARMIARLTNAFQQTIDRAPRHFRRNGSSS